MSPDAAREALRELVKAGMLERDGTVYNVPPDIEGIADRLAVSRGALARRTRLAERIAEERARPRGDMPPDDEQAVVDKDDERRRQEEDLELMRQMGVL